MPTYKSSLLLIVSCGFAWTAALGQSNESCPAERSVSVTASGTAAAEADVAIVHVGYRVYGTDAKSAYASASATSNAIVEALTGSGVTQSAIESSSQALQRTSAYELQMLRGQSDAYSQRQFTAQQSWTIRVKPDAAAKTLDTAISAGANESGWIEWEIEDPSSLQAQASAKALANAHRIAERSLQNSGVQLGPLLRATESKSSAPNGLVTGMAGMAGGSIGGPESLAPLAINSRRVEFEASVFAVFAIQ